MTKSDHQAFTILEAIVAMFILTFMFTGLFFIFSFGSRGFQQANDQTGLLSEVSRLRSKIEQDLTLTTYASTSKVDRTFTDYGSTTRRDALGFLAISDWSDPNSLDPSTCLPHWNRYTVYSTPQAEERNLTRVSINPTTAASPAGLDVIPYPLLTSLLEDIPASEIVNRSVLSKNLFRFEVELDDLNSAIGLNVELRRTGGLRATSQNRRDESLQAFFRVQPRNNGPGVGG
jgi:type II secretory pathway pseudopilin PulG